MRERAPTHDARRPSHREETAKIMSMATAVNATYQLERVVPLNRKVSGEPLYVHLVRHNYDLKWIADASPCLTGESVLLVHLDARTADWFGLEELLGPDLLAGGLWYHKTARTWNVT